MAEQEENPFHNIRSTETEVNEEDVQRAQQDPNFHKFLEKVSKRMGKDTS